MATLVLGVVGGVLGGPIGAALGSLAGQAIDRQVLASKGRQGPRLGDLSVQTSSYGSALPRLFGTMRVAGTVIWSTDLREDTHHSGSAKTGGKTTTYTYSASFAVALSARPILSVGRIWADGNLLRGSACDWKSDLGAFRLHLGDEYQAVDPLIAAAEGIDAAPAHRGLAYAVFETLQLADFGNRIPSLTFELTADPADVGVEAIACELTGGAMAASGAGSGVTLGGFAASGDSVRGALEAVIQAAPLPLADDGAVLRISDPTLTTIPASLLGAAPEASAGAAHVRERGDAGALPDAIALGYYEPARDYQFGLQRARRDGIGRSETRIDLPAAVPADSARMLAEDTLVRAWRQRGRATARVPWSMLGARVGTLVTIDGEGPWRIAGWTLERMALELALVRAGDAAPLLPGAAAGRATVGLDAAPGATVLALLDLPGLDDTLPAAPRMYLAAAGTREGWRRAAVSLSLDDGASWQSVGQTALPAVIGNAATVLASGTALLEDRLSTVDIDLLHGGMALAGADADALAAGANLASLGGELIQFGAAQQLSATRWRLGRLWRGRRGTQGATTGHAVGERFVLLDPATLLALDVPLARIGTIARVSALGPGDDAVAATDAATVVGRALRPPAPVHLAASRRADGTIDLAWTRRSRLGWAWLDGADAPLAEDVEHYRLTLTRTGGATRVVEVGTPAYSYSPAEQAADGGAGTGLDVTLVQLGTSAPSDPPATASWSWS